MIGKDKDAISRAIRHAAREVQDDIRGPGTYTVGETVTLLDGRAARIEVELRYSVTDPAPVVPLREG